LLAILALAVGLGLRHASWDVPSAPPTARVPDLVLDVNTAPEPVLAALPHVGPALVRRLVEARNQRPFTSPEDLKARVRGVGPVTLARIAPYLRFEPASGSQPEPPEAPQRKTTRPRKRAPATIPPNLTAMTTPAQPRPITSPAR
jgi:competence protein ComEA